MMRILSMIFMTSTIVCLIGCGNDKGGFEGPTNDEFTGRLVQNGKPVTFDAGRNLKLQITHESSESFGIPIQSDGSFKIGWMPIGKYSANLMNANQDRGARGQGLPINYAVPGGFTIEEGKTDYSIELGPKFKQK